MTIRVRVAPAPSGSLHVGVVRTALFNWLFARHNGGTFILRVEDTDQSRVAPEHYDAIQEDLHWIGLDWDEGPGVGGPHEPYRQSERIELYRDAVDRMLEANAVYRCYCTREELEERRKAALAAKRRPGYDGRCYRLTDEERSRFEAEGRPFSIRFHVPDEGSTSFNDIITGEVRWDHNQMDDFVIVRSDGLPLYDLAATVDDGAMKISHVVRGLDLQSSTPRQILMHTVLGNEIPEYGHLPLINGPDGAKLSKRHGATALAWYRERGFLPEAMRNYLALQGWGTAEESIFTKDELIEKFDLGQVHASPARFDAAKLEWMSGEHIRMLEDADLVRRLEPFLAAAGLIETPPSPDQKARLDAIAPEVKTRIRTLEEAPALVRGIFTDDVEPDPETVEKFLRDEGVPTLLEKAIDALSSIDGWDLGAIDTALHSVVDEMGLKPRKAYVPFYIAIHGSRVGAPLFNSMELIGREKTLERLRKIASISAGAR
jgi:glutamyl-tRNA synthetase